MYAVAVRDVNNTAGADHSATAYGGGVYLFAQSRRDGWGGTGLGAKNNWEHYGQQWGRWFVTLPYGVVNVNQPMSANQYAGRLYMCGGYSYNTVLDEHHRMWKQGILPPAEIPTIAGGGAPAGNFAYFSWWDDYTQERSPLSSGLEIGAATPRVWSSLPTRPPDDIYVADDGVTTPTTYDGQYSPTGSNGNRLYQLRPGDKMSVDNAGAFDYGQVFHFNPLLVDPQIGTHVGELPVVVVPVSRATHLELWLSMDGDLPRLAMRVAIGTTTVTESTAVADLGESFSESFQRFPRATMNTIYHDRQVVAGNPENPDVVYLSELYYPERYAGLTFRTRNGQPVTGLLATRDYCLVFTRSTTYMLQGYTDTDYSMTVIDQSLGSVGHNCNIVIHGNPYVWTEKGPFMFNGQWHPLSPENRWASMYTAAEDIDPGQNMIATDDPLFNTYIVSNAAGVSRMIGTPFRKSVMDPVERGYAVLDYTLVQPETGGVMAPARLSFDTPVYQPYMLDGTMDSTASAVTDGTVPAKRYFEFMKFIRNRYGFGRLYHIGCRWTQVVDSKNRAFSFAAIPLYDGMDRSNDLGAPNFTDLTTYDPYFIRLASRMTTGFYYFNDPEAYSWEAKSFKRLWFHMRNWRLDNLTNRIEVYTAPDSGYWDHYHNAAQNQGGYTYDDPVQIPTYPSGGFNRLLEPAYTFTASDRLLTDNVTTPSNPDDILAEPEAHTGDVIMAPLPDALAGRGLWINVFSHDLQWHGFGVQILPGSDSVLYIHQEDG